MLDSDRTLLKAAILRVEALHAGMRTADLDEWLDRVVYLCRLKNGNFGRKRNPSGRISPNTLGIRFGDQGHFIGVDIARDGTGELRPQPWPEYPDLGPHLPEPQEWVQQRASYVNTRWEDTDSPGPAPISDLSAICNKLDVIIAHHREAHAQILKVGSDAADARDSAYTAAVESSNIARRLLALLAAHFPDVPID